MRKIRYRSGDTIVLKAGVLGSVHPDGAGRITSVLPETQGLSPQYRVRFQNENFERNIAHDDIDAEASTARPQDAENAASLGATSNWINPNAIRIRK
ncbi:cold-shock protein [Rhizobium sp. LjRoot30]|uniref:cold-shock protein n=1 Tax=Rhizobium sp. LjRoot30 TaxID=3342320 RepID=UPI003ECECD86